MAHMPDMLAETERALGVTWNDVSRLFHRIPVSEGGNATDLTTRPPAVQPVNLAAATAAAATPQEETMSLVQIEDDVRTDLTDGLNWLDGFVQRVRAAAPGIISTVDTVSGTTVGKLAETLAGAVIPPQYEPMLVGLVEDFARRYGQPATPVTDPAPTGQQPAAAPAQ